MVSKWEILEYLRVFGSCTNKDIKQTFSEDASFVLYKLVYENYVKRTRHGKNVMFELSTTAINYLEHQKLKSFIDGNPRALRMEKILKRKFWRPDENLFI